MWPIHSKNSSCATKHTHPTQIHTMYVYSDQYIQYTHTHMDEHPPLLCHCPPGWTVVSVYANWTPSVTWSLFRGLSTGDISSTNVIPGRGGREGRRDSKVWHKLCNVQRGEGVMNVQRMRGGGMREGRREGGGGISLVPRPHPLMRRKGLVNQVKFLGLAHAFMTM